VDHVDRKKRSLIMAAVHSEDTGPEMAVRRILHGLGYRYRLHVRALPGRPDMVFPARRKIVFVHGCFWHRHGDCQYATSPKTRKVFWQSKFADNVERDRRAKRELKRMGWTVLTVWQCELKKRERLTRRLNDFLSN
jgi:DNA mismatch endonuclease (patch repair protein)